MKKRIISTILAACMVLALGACGSSATDEGKSDAESREQSTDSKQSTDSEQSTGLFSRKDDKSESMTVIADGKEYDLTGGFQQVAEKMEKNGLNILWGMTSSATPGYYKNGKINKLSIGSEDYTKETTNSIFAYETPICRGDIETCPIVVDSYEFGALREKSAAFETADGITGEADDDDLKMLEDFVPMYSALDYDVFYMALYVDGEKVDLQMYRDVYDELVKEAEESDVRSAIINRFNSFNTKYFSGGTILSGKYRRLLEGYDEGMSIEEFEKAHSHLRENIMFYSAVQEKFEALEAKEIDSVDIVIYDYYKYQDSWMMQADYLHYYVDENWDYSKFVE